MVCSVELVDLCSDSEDDETISPTITYEEYLSTKKINPLVQDKVTKEWKKIGEIKSVIEKLLIKHFFVSFYTPVGAMAKVSEWYSTIKVNQSKMTAKYRVLFKDSDDEAKAVAERLSVVSAMDAYSRKKNILENIEMERQKVNGIIAKINRLDPNLGIPEMHTVVHFIKKTTKATLKQFHNTICEYCSHLVVYDNPQTLNKHTVAKHSDYFKNITDKFYFYADQLADERFKKAVEELKSEIAGQELFVVFLTPSLKDKVEKIMEDMEKNSGTTRKVNSGQDQRREVLFDDRSQDSYRSDGIPQSGRGGYSKNERPSLHNNYDSLPPPFKKKCEEDRMHQSQPDGVPQTAVHPSPVETEWDGGSRTFVNISGAPKVRPSLPHPYPQSSPHVSSIQQKHTPQQHHRPGSVDGNDSIPRKNGTLKQRTLFDFFAKQSEPLMVANKIDNGKIVTGSPSVPLAANAPVINLASTSTSNSSPIASDRKRGTSRVSNTNATAAAGSSGRGGTGNSGGGGATSSAMASTSSGASASTSGLNLANYAGLNPNFLSSLHHLGADPKNPLLAAFDPKMFGALDPKTSTLCDASLEPKNNPLAGLDHKNDLSMFGGFPGLGSLGGLGSFGALGNMGAMGNMGSMQHLFSNLAGFMPDMPTSSAPSASTTNTTTKSSSASRREDKGKKPATSSSSANVNVNANAAAAASASLPFLSLDKKYEKLEKLFRKELFYSVRLDNQWYGQDDDQDKETA